MELDTLVVEFLRSGSITGAAISFVLLYLALEARGLRRSVGRIDQDLRAVARQMTQQLADHSGRIAKIEGRMEEGGTR